MFKRTLLGIVSAIMLIATVVLSGCGSSDPMLGKWIAPVSSNLLIGVFDGAYEVTIEKNGDDQKTRVVTISIYSYDNRSVKENQAKNEMLMVWSKMQSNKQILPIENNIIRLPLGTIAYDQNKKCLVSDGIEFKKADEKGVKEAKASVQDKFKAKFIGKYTRLPSNMWDSSSSYVVKNIIFKDATAK